MTLRLEVRKRMTHAALTAWEITVANAAPLTPRSSTKIRMGSSTIFSTAPITTDSIAVFDSPCPLINVFKPTATCTKIVPIR